MSNLEKYIEAYVHQGRIGVLIEVTLDSFTSSQMEEFTKLTRDLALQVAASNPSDIEELCKQPFVKNEAITVEQHISGINNKLRENISVTRFVRWDTEWPRPLIDTTPPDGPAVAVRLKRVK